MKNKLYYVLFLIYAAVTAFVLHINGVFTGEESSLVFNFMYRSIMADAYGKLVNFLSVFRQTASRPIRTVPKS